MPRISDAGAIRIVGRWLAEMSDSRVWNRDRGKLAEILFTRVLEDMPKDERALAVLMMVGMLAEQYPEEFATAYLEVQQQDQRLDDSLGDDDTRH